MAPEANLGHAAAVATSKVVSSIPSVPVTMEHRTPADDLDQVIKNPGQPRATRAVSREKPEGSPTSSDTHTVIQQHVMFWDRDGDGIIWPSDTYVGFRRLGFNVLYSLAAVPFIHGSFSYASSPSWIPDPFFRIFFKNLHRTKHGSDSGVIDNEGRFVPQKFEEIFSKYDEGAKGGLSWADIQRMVRGNSVIMDPTGWTAERLEWWTTYALLANENKVVPKEMIRGMYDGTIWPVVAEKVAREKLEKKLGKGKAA